MVLVFNLKRHSFHVMRCDFLKKTVAMQTINQTCFHFALPDFPFPGILVPKQKRHHEQTQFGEFVFLPHSKIRTECMKLNWHSLSFIDMEKMPKKIRQNHIFFVTSKPY